MGHCLCVLFNLMTDMLVPCRKQTPPSEKAHTTAPDYSVEEDDYGRLINREKLMIWPERKPRKRAEFEKLIRTAPSEVPLVSPAPSTCTDVFFVTPRSSASIMLIQEGPETELEAAFIGGATPAEAAAKVDPSSFALYYRIENPLSDRAYLFMAYKSSRGRAFHFPLSCRKIKLVDGSEEACWRVEYGDPDAIEFPSLSALVRYYRVFCYYDLRTGAVEAFPLWSDHRIVIDDD